MYHDLHSCLYFSGTHNRSAMRIDRAIVALYQLLGTHRNQLLNFFNIFLGTAFRNFRQHITLGFATIDMVLQ